MILVIGEILFDLFLDTRKLGGAPFNFAYHLKKLGMDVRFFSRVGQDELGREILRFLEKNGFDTNDIQQDEKYPTGTVAVKMGPDGSHTFSIRKNAAYDQMVMGKRLKSVCESGWDMFYTGTLIQRNANNANLVQTIFRNKRPGGFVFCDINLRPGCYTADNIKACLKGADVLKLSEEEVKAVFGINPELNREKMQAHLNRFMAVHGIDTLILTLGSRGSQWYSKGQCMESPKIPGSFEVKDTVGAGDAYAAMAAAGLLTRMDTAQIIELSQQFAGLICRETGALPEDDAVYQRFKRRFDK